MVVKEYKKHAGVYKVQTFRTTQSHVSTSKFMGWMLAPRFAQKSVSSVIKFDKG
jgi:hypothetical protein